MEEYGNVDRSEAHNSVMNQVDYTPVSGMKWAAISSSDFIKMCSSLKFLGSKCFITQHNIGASKYTKVSSSKIVGTHQLQARHILYGDTSKATVIIKGDFHGVARLIYSKSEDGGWKFAGLSPTVYGVEHSSIDELMGTIAARVESGELVD